MSTQKSASWFVGMALIGVAAAYGGCTSVYDEFYKKLQEGLGGSATTSTGGTGGIGGTTGTGGTAGAGGATSNCDDDTQNGNETDVDCGGTCGPTCVVGQSCMDGGDCVSGVCDLNGHKCYPAGCGDGVQNGKETDTDCGGVDCPKCGPDLGCVKNSDCMGNECKDQVCVANCKDGILNNGESDLDCGASSSDCPKCSKGKKCADKANCEDGLECAEGDKDLPDDNICCDQKCETPCNSCSKAATGSEDGTCAVVKLGEDPYDDCATSDVTSCGTTGFCDGAGTCSFHSSGVSCGVAASCQLGSMGYQETTAQICNGAGSCEGGMTNDCGLYGCNGTVCKSACVTDADCYNGGMGGALGTYCSSAAKCIDKKQQGTQCGATSLDPASNPNAECETGYCVDGVCCNALCDGFCQACVAAKQGPGGTNGTCGNIAVGSDPDMECPFGYLACDGNGMCKGKDGSQCVDNSWCAKGHCTEVISGFGVCCNTPCGGTCNACSFAKTGKPDGVCSNITPGTDPDNDCTGNSGLDVCNASGQCSN